MSNENLPTIRQLYDENVILAKHNDLNILLNQEPKANWIKTHPIYKKVTYIPIERIEWLLTNIFKGHFETLYDSGKIPHMSYDSIIKSCDIGFAKPEKEIFEIATQRAGATPWEIFYIDNRKEYVDEVKR